MEEQEDHYGYVLHSCCATDGGAATPCQRCLGIEAGTMPREDGIYLGESGIEFEELYVWFWDAQEGAGELRFDAEGFVDNRVILRQVRHTMQQGLLGYLVYSG